MFLEKIKSGFLLVLACVAFTSCGEYQKVLKSSDTTKKYTMAETFYNEAKEEDSNKKYRKALRLFEQIIPEFRGKPQGERVAFLLADTYYQLGDHYLAGYQFERFTQSYPTSQKIEEAAFKSAKSYYFLSPRYDLDQTDTFKAIEELQKYINNYPEGEHIEEANKLAADLRVKVEKKAYEIAKQYHLTQNYKAAIVAFGNFINEYPGSPFRESAFYYRFDSAYQLAINSYQYLMQERLKTAQDFYHNYLKYYPESSIYYNRLIKAFEDVQSRLENI